MATVATAVLTAIAGVAFLGVILLILGFLSFGILAPIGGFAKSRADAHRALARKTPATRSHVGRAALHR